MPPLNPADRPTGTPAIPWRALLGITALVLAVHLAFLYLLPARDRQAPPPAPLAFTTRTITLNPVPATPPPPATQATPPAPRPAPARRPRPAPKPPPPDTSSAMADNGTAAPPPEPDTPASESPGTAEAPVASAPPEVPAETAPPASPATEPAPLTLPGSVRLLYDVSGQVKKMDYHARSELLWLQDGSHYDLRFEVSAFLVGSRVQTSRGDITALGLAPLRFSDKSRSERAAHFDYGKGQVTFSANSPNVPLTPGAQDRLSVFIQLGAQLAGNPGAFPVGTTITQQTVGPRDADLWSAVVAGEETIRVQGEVLNTLRLVRPPAREFDSKVELWYAPSMGYLPVRIRLTQFNGDFADMQLRATETP